MKKGDKVVCKKDYDIYAKSGDIFLIIEYAHGCVSLKGNSNITIINKTFNEYFMTLSEYRDKRINDILG